jgi:xanthine dehydrogenase YagS FAD-binding subunit
VELRRASSLDELRGGLPIHGGTEVVPLLRAGLLSTDTLVDVRGVVPAGVATSAASGSTIGAGTTLAALETDPTIPAALREACRLAASPQIRNVGSLGGNLLQATRCWYWRLDFPCRLHRVESGWGDECHAIEGEHREHAVFANDFCASAHPSDAAAALLALDATLVTTARRLGIAELYRIPTEDDRRTTTLADGELILEIELPACESSVYLKAMERKLFGFPLVGVAAALVDGTTRVALAGVAPVPWLLAEDGFDSAGFDSATPLPGNAYKLEIATALVRRARAALTAAS